MGCVDITNGWLDITVGQSVVFVAFGRLEGPFWHRWGPFGWSRRPWGYPTGPFRVHIWIFIDFGWILGPPLGAVSEPWDVFGATRSPKCRQHEAFFERLFSDSIRSRFLIRFWKAWDSKNRGFAWEGLQKSSFQGSWLGRVLGSILGAFWEAWDRF